MDSEELLRKRLLDLAAQSYRQNIYTYTGFLSMDELNIYEQMKGELVYAAPRVWGGQAACERCMVGFGSEELLGYPGEFPICRMKAEPTAEKFAEEISHRDVLGALMHLGIERSLIGDIIIRGKTAWFFCTDTIAPYLTENLIQIRHNRVRCQVVTGEVVELAPELESMVLNVASPRLDAVAAALTGQSRSRISSLFQEKKVFVNGRCRESGSLQLSPGDVISLRGYGKAIYDGVLGETKKGRCRIAVRRYR